jgi:replicative DNA helicase
MNNIKRDPLRIIYGHILHCDKNEQRNILNRIKPEFNKTTFEKRLFDSMNQLVKKNVFIDLLSITNQFRENGWLEKSTIVEISQITNHVNVLDGKMALNNLFHDLHINESVFRAVSFRNNFDQLIESGSMTIDKFNELVDGMKKIDFTMNNETKSNVDVIFDVINDHIRAKNGENVGMSIGYSFLNRIINLEPVDLMVIGARPAMGKTAFGVSMVANLIQMEKRVVFFALEMTQKQMMRRLIANLAVIDSNRIKFGECSDSEMNRIYDVQSRKFMENIIFIDGTQSISDIANHLNELNREKPIDLFVVDYLQKIQPKSNRSKYESVSEISTGLKLICQNMKIPCVAFAQLNRASVQRGGDHRPVLNDLKDSGEIEQDASIVGFIHRPEYYGTTEMFDGSDSSGKCELIIAKNRESEIGIYQLNVNLSISKFYT